MSATEQQELGDIQPTAEADPGPHEVRASWHRHGKDPAAVADALGRPESAIREELAGTRLHATVGMEPEDMAGQWPHEVGLSPLGCGQCGAEAIVVHPCPECGFDPRDGGGS